MHTRIALGDRNLKGLAGFSANRGDAVDCERRSDIAGARMRSKSNRKDRGTFDGFITTTPYLASLFDFYVTCTPLGSLLFPTPLVGPSCHNSQPLCFCLSLR